MRFFKPAGLRSFFTLIFAGFLYDFTSAYRISVFLNNDASQLEQRDILLTIYFLLNLCIYWAVDMRFFKPARVCEVFLH